MESRRLQLFSSFLLLGMIVEEGTGIIFHVDSNMRLAKRSGGA
jgi:hypothetical protein